MKTIGATLLCLLLGSTGYADDGFYVLRASTPLIASASAGFRFGGDEDDLRATLQGEAGFGGGKILLGMDNTGVNDLGFGLKAAYLRTWLEPIEVDENQDFIGLEGEISIKRLVINVGGYVNVGDGDDDSLLSAGLGFIF